MVRSFNPNVFSPVIAELLAEDRLPDLGPGKPNEKLRPKLQALRPADLAGKAIQDDEAARACLAGLWLWHDFLDESHTLSQEIHTPEGSYWHGVMHRREPDYSNAKYWFRQFGAHPVYNDLTRCVQEVLKNQVSSSTEDKKFLEKLLPWDACAFVDVCQGLARSGANDVVAREIARAEWQLLFKYCWQKAFG